MNILSRQAAPLSIDSRLNNATATANGNNSAVGFIGISRGSSSNYSARIEAINHPNAVASQAPQSGNVYLYRLNWATSALSSNVGISFYSIGTSLDLSVLDTLVSRLLADFRSIDEDGMDRDALAYIRNVEAADGGYLELGVKKAIDTFVRGCKYDGIWNAIKASSVLCGARTLAGALTPLAGAAPTNNNFVDADYNRETGLVGNGSTKYLDSNRSGTADGRNDHHVAFYSTASGGASYPIGVRYGIAPNYYTTAGYDFYSRSAVPGTGVSSLSVGTYGLSRSNGSSFNWIRASGSVSSATNASAEVVGNANHFVFALNAAGSASGTTSGTLAFYSIGSALDLALLDTRVTALVTSIGAAL
jgi:hypothetical protein